MIVQTTLKTPQRRRASGVTIDSRPLYLAPSSDTYVSLDGPALCVSREERAPQLFPLQRL
jgi:hypothetical protein